MIRPTTIPQTLNELLIEHAVAREALRMGFLHHKSLARPLLGVAHVGSMEIGGAAWYESYIDMLRMDRLGATGGLLSHGPRRAQTMLILIDGFGVEGATMLFQDSIFMMPHLGVLSTVHPEAAIQIFDKDCVVRLGTCIAPKGAYEKDEGQRVATVTLTMPNGETITEEMKYGTMKKIPLKEGEFAQMDIRPERGFDMGEGSGHRVTKKVEGGVVGLILDARGRPIALPQDDNERRKRLGEWLTALQAYPGFP
jgi:hypothetical protein